MKHKMSDDYLRSSFDATCRSLTARHQPHGIYSHAGIKKKYIYIYIPPPPPEKKTFIYTYKNKKNTVGIKCISRAAAGLIVNINALSE
jgi:hypothetical protein